MASFELLTARPLSTQQVCPPPAPKGGGGGVHTCRGVNISEDARHYAWKSRRTNQSINQSWETKSRRDLRRSVEGKRWVAGAFHKLYVVEAEDSRVVVVTLNYTRVLYKNSSGIFVPSLTSIRIVLYSSHAETVFLNFKGAQESVPRNWFRQLL